jgi:hypothetical protein
VAAAKKGGSSAVYCPRRAAVSARSLGDPHSDGKRSRRSTPSTALDAIPDSSSMASLQASMRKLSSRTAKASAFVL